MSEDRQREKRKWKTATASGALVLLLGLFWSVGVDRLVEEESPNPKQAATVEEERMVEERDVSDAALDRLHLVSRVPDVYSSERISGEGIVGDLVGDRGFWLTQPDGLRKTLVIVDSEAERSRLRAGERVRISGHVYQTSGLNEASMAELSAAAQAALKKERAFIFSRQILGLGLDKGVPSLALTKPKPGENSK